MLEPDGQFTSAVTLTTATPATDQGMDALVTGGAGPSVRLHPKPSCPRSAVLPRSDTSLAVPCNVACRLTKMSTYRRGPMTLSDRELDTGSLGEAAYLRIRADIVRCRLAPGERLTERRLATDTGFGVSPIRDALTRLDHEGLVRTLPRKGYQVKPLTIKAVDDLFDFWAVLGPEVARRGVVGATEEQLDRIIACGAEIASLTKEQGRTREATQRTVEIIDQMFTILAEATRNDYMISTCARLSGELTRVWILVIDSELLDYGEPLVPLGRWKDNFLLRDGDKFAEFARYYIEQSHNRVLRTLARWPSVVATEVVPLRKTTPQ
ncbi:GntR family transcriptional regulator [Streptomyces graminofaciens]